MRFEVKYVMSAAPHTFRQRVCRWLFWLLGFTLGALCSPSAQQANDLQQQVDQLRQQYEQTTQDLQQKIAAPGKQIENRKSRAAKEKDESEKNKIRDSLGGGKTEMLERLQQRDLSVPAGRISQEHAPIVADRAAAGSFAHSAGRTILVRAVALEQAQPDPCPSFGFIALSHRI